MHLLPKASLALATLAALGLSTHPAQAQGFQNSTGIASPVTTLTFNEVVLPSGTQVLTSYTAYGVTFSPNVTYSPQNVSFPHVDGSNLGNTSVIRNPFSIFFNTTLTSAGFALVTNPGTTTFTALLNGATVDSFTAATDIASTNNFFGFQGESFNQIRISAGGYNGGALLDNLQLGRAPGPAVPEPSSVASMGLGGAGLLGLLLRARKRRRAA